MKRKREYTIYATSPGEGFTVYSVNYSNGTHRWTYTVYATSIRQAYALAGRGAFASGPDAVGIRVLERDWWHGDCPVQGDCDGCSTCRKVAPYLMKPKGQARTFDQIKEEQLNCLGE